MELTGGHPAGTQVGDLVLSSSLDFTAPDSLVATGTGPTAAVIWAGAAINVGEVKAGLARDIAKGLPPPRDSTMPSTPAAWSPESNRPRAPVSGSEGVGQVAHHCTVGAVRTANGGALLGRARCPRARSRTPGRIAAVRENQAVTDMGTDARCGQPT
ncbi:hypothetical protein GCM10027073_17270 [Streptomyces chlorus]